MNTEKYLFEKAFPMSSRTADFSGRLRLSSLINLYIQAAWQHAEILGFGFSDLNKNKSGWALSRFMVQLDHLPDWPGDVVIQTWPKGLNRLFYMRDAVFMNSSGEQFAAITSAWLVFDINSKRPKILESQPDSLYHHQDKHALNEPVPSLKPQGEPVKKLATQIRYNDIDLNQHLTAIRYLDFMTDTYDQDFFRTNQPTKLVVNYIREITFGTTIEMIRYENGSIHSFELINTVDNTVCFRGEISWKER